MECIFIQSKYNFDKEKHNFGHQLLRNGYRTFPVAIETTVCVRNLSLFNNNGLQVSYFHISHRKAGSEYVCFSDIFMSKSPVVKYSPLIEQQLSNNWHVSINK